MNVGILGLGLIGGSLARAYALAGHTVYAADSDGEMLSFAMLSGAVHGILDEKTIPECELILLAIYPGGSAGWLEENGKHICVSALVLDCCGVKEEVCRRRSGMVLPLWAATPWQVPTFQASSTAVPPCSGARLWCWSLRGMTIWTFSSG